MKTTFKQFNDAHALLKAITLIYSQEKIENIYGEGLNVLYSALDEIEVEKDMSVENELVKKKIIDAFDVGFTEGCRYTTGFEQTQWYDADDYYSQNFK